MKRLHVVLSHMGATLLALLPVAACAVHLGEPTSEESAPIINGTPVTVTSQGVVRLVQVACSATLLNNQWALTAAHCGSHVGDQVVMGTQTGTVARVVNHPNSASGVDVALVQLASPMTMNGSTTGFRELLRRSLAPVNTALRCFGYGRSDNTSGTDATLRTANLAVSGNANSRYSFLPSASGQGVAAGDAGGPCFDGDGYVIAVLGTSPVVGVPGEGGAVSSNVYVNWADDTLAGFTLDFGTLVQNYGGLDFGIPSSWEAIQGDFDGDGKTDYARVGSAGAWLFFSNGDGTFTTVFQNYGGLAFGQPSPWQTITGDFNGDGKLDYARLGDTGAWLFFGHANRSLTSAFQAYALPSLNFGLPSTWQAISGDFNGDGKTDYARLGDTGAWIFFGSAGSVNGAFSNAFQFYSGVNFGLPSAWQVITGDFNGDGKMDYARLGDTGAWIFPGNANGTFGSAFQAYTNLNFGLPSSWQTITGDFNGDGKTDYARLGDTGAWVFFAGAGATFTRAFQFYNGLNFELPSPWQPITGDFNGDGKIDYARLGDTGAWMYFGNANSTFIEGFQSYAGQTFGLPSAWQAITGNFKGDGKIVYMRLGGASSYIFVHR